jgi:hypothetical protein
MKRLTLIIVIISFLTTGLLKAQNISLYCVGNDTAGGQAINPAFYKVDAFSATTTVINTLSEVYGTGQGSSSFDNSNNHYVFSGNDTNHVKRLYTVDTLGNILYNPAMSNLMVSALQYDFKTHNTYSIVYDTSTSTRHFGIINTDNANIILLNQLDDITGVGVGGVTFNSNTGKYIFIGAGLGGANDFRLFIINALTGIIETNISINNNLINTLQYDVVHNKLYGIYRDTCCLMPKYFVEIDTLTADIIILDTLNTLYGIGSGSQIYDQATGTFIFIGRDTLMVDRLYTIDASTGQVISDAPTSAVIGDLECDNTKFAKSFYTSVQDAKTLLSNISVYPNPANGHFEIEFTLENPQTVNISLVNSIGQIVYQKSNKNFQGNYSDKIDSRSFANGNYILNIKTGENTHTENITVLH